MSTPRERILDTATRLFHNQGYNNTGINQIILEASVAKASFYQHFKSKDELCIEYLNKRHDYWFTAFSNFVAKANNTKNRILAAFDFIIEMNKKEDFRGCAFINILPEINIDQGGILEIVQSHKKDLKKFFERELNSKLLSTHIYLLFESALLESKLFKSNQLVTKSKAIINDII